MNPSRRHQHQHQLPPPHPRSTSSCAACKFLKRRCVPTCIFAPYFRSDEPKKFAKVHKVFGASNVSKILYEVAEEQREDAVNSLAFEAEARLRDPVYGCIGAIALLQRRLFELQHDLAVARAKLARYAAAAGAASSTTTTQPMTNCSSSSMVTAAGVGNTNMDGMTTGGSCDGYNDMPPAVAVMGGGQGMTTRGLEDECWGFHNGDVGLYSSSTNFCVGGGVTEMNGIAPPGLIQQPPRSDQHYNHQGLAATTGGEFGLQAAFPL